MAPSARPAPTRPVESVDPATGEVWKRFETTPPEAVVLEAVRKARTAQRDWAGEPVGARVRVLRRFHESLFRRRREVAEALTRENGKPVAEAIGSEIAIALDFANYYARETPRFLRAPWFNAGPLAMKRKRIRVTHEPFGVIGVISPWNYPFMLSAGVVIPALVTGNAVLLKPSEFTPESGELLASLFHEAGVPPDVFAVLQGDGSTGAALCDAAGRQDLLHRQRADRPARRREVRGAADSLRARARRKRRGDRAGGRGRASRRQRHRMGKIRERRPDVRGAEAHLRGGAGVRRVRGRARQGGAGAQGRRGRRAGDGRRPDDPRRCRRRARVAAR